MFIKLNNYGGKMKLKTKGVKETFELAGVGVGLGIVGKAFDSTGLQEGGQAAVKFVPVMANISGASMTLDMLKELKKKK